mmetsp:Transcript_4005/g.11191  ORF Transcript_4005/g.11191 Transcript_4005/m.11191 type:complete len:208 (+) Transcript_4005:218-841(+)
MSALKFCLRCKTVHSVPYHRLGQVVHEFPLFVPRIGVARRDCYRQFLAQGNFVGSPLGRIFLEPGHPIPGQFLHENSTVSLRKLEALQKIHPLEAFSSHQSKGTHLLFQFEAKRNRCFHRLYLGAGNGFHQLSLRHGPLAEALRKCRLALVNEELHAGELRVRLAVECLQLRNVAEWHSSLRTPTQFRVRVPLRVPVECACKDERSL